MTKGWKLLLHAIGAALPAALAVALSPFPVIGIVLILAGRHGGLVGDDVSGGKALMLSAVLSGVNPKNVVLTAAASTSIIEADVHFLGGQRGANLLDGVRQFMVANSVVITVVIP